eukprot:gb/GECG01001329.1/.p1 GENE.gb/GECG01001329.1/~~gb/GECG01001329.1/.p1  ORF type:complete len:192 (+),score=15.24 gb/GECG01001329.1/:1-576(+)
MLPSQEDGHIFSSAYASAEFFWGQSVSHQADVTLDEDSFARDLMAGNGTNGDSGYPQTFFESVGKAFCSSTDDMHCLTDSFLTAPAAGIFILMIPFLSTNAVAVQGSLPEASRTRFTWSVLALKHRRRFRLVMHASSSEILAESLCLISVSSRLRSLDLRIETFPLPFRLFSVRPSSFLDLSNFLTFCVFI